MSERLESGVYGTSGSGIQETGYRTIFGKAIMTAALKCRVPLFFGMMQASSMLAKRSGPEGPNDGSSSSAPFRIGESERFVESMAGELTVAVAESGFRATRALQEGLRMGPGGRKINNLEAQARSLTLREEVAERNSLVFSLQAARHRIDLAVVRRGLHELSGVAENAGVRQSSSACVGAMDENSLPAERKKLYAEQNRVRAALEAEYFQSRKLLNKGENDASGAVHAKERERKRNLEEAERLKILRAEKMEAVVRNEAKGRAIINRAADAEKSDGLTKLLKKVAVHGTPPGGDHVLFDVLWRSSQATGLIGRPPR